MNARRRSVALFLACVFAPTAGAAQRVTTLTMPFEASGDLAVSADGDIFVANFGPLLNSASGREVYRVTDNGDVNVFATGFVGASGNTFDAAGNLYQSSIAANRVSRIAPDGSVTTVATGLDGLRNPVGLTFDADGSLYIANCGNASILAMDQAGVVRTLIASPLLSCPNGLTSDSSGNLYAANFNNGDIVKITADGQAELFARTPGGPTKPAGGNGHIIFGNERLYVVSNASHQVFELSLSGELSVLAGTGQQGRSDGPAAEAEFSLPNGIDLSPDGSTLYVNDSVDASSNNNAIAPNVVRAISLSATTGGIAIQPGLTGAWFDPRTPGQGMLFDVSPEADLFFVAWFTFELSAGGKVGAAEQRWLTAQGPMADGQLPLFSTSGGVFNRPDPTRTESVGSLRLIFDSCTEARASYELDEQDRAGTLELVRITPNAFCDPASR